MRVLVRPIIVLMLAAFIGSLPATAHPWIGTSWRVAPLPADPGFPEGVAVVGHLAYVTGPATFGNAGADASRIYVINLRSHRIVDEIVIQGQDPDIDHAVAGIAADAEGRLYVATVPGGVLRIDPETGAEEVYAVIPDSVPPFPGIPDLPPLLNDMVFDNDGTLYLTDTLQATIWRIPPGAPGGVAEKFLENPQWLGDPAACGPAGCFGLNGIRFGRDGLLYFGATALPEGFIFRVPTHGTLADVETFTTIAPGEGPDGMAFSRRGRLYVTMAFSNDIVVYDRNGAEVDRFSGPIWTFEGEQIPYDGPAVLAFYRRSIVVVNHAPVTGNPDNFALFRVLTGERGLRLQRPHIP